MNNSRQDDSDFMINIPAYNCCVCQHLSHARKLDTEVCIDKARMDY